MKITYHPKQISVAMPPHLACFQLQGFSFTELSGHIHVKLDLVAKFSSRFHRKFTTAINSAISLKKMRNFGSFHPGGGFSGMRKARSR